LSLLLESLSALALAREFDGDFPFLLHFFWLVLCCFNLLLLIILMLSRVEDSEIAIKRFGKIIKAAMSNTISIKPREFKVRVPSVLHSVPLFQS
jgi:hypothetical protein